MTDVNSVREALLAQVATLEVPRDVLKAPEFKQLYAAIGSLDPSERAAYGKSVNELKIALETAVDAREAELESADITPIDVTAPWDVNSKHPALLPTDRRLSPVKPKKSMSDNNGANSEAERLVRNKPIGQL